MAVLKGNGSILEAFGGLLKDTAAGKAFKSGWGVVTSGVDELGLAMAKDVATRSALIPGADEAAKATRQKLINEAAGIKFKTTGKMPALKGSLKPVSGERAGELLKHGRWMGAGTMAQSAQHWITATDHVGSADRWKNIAARAGVTMAGIGVAGRLVSGGSLTHDREGRFNVAGLPFI